MEKVMKAELIEDKNIAGQYRVEAIDNDGGCEVAIFAGPRAFERAAAFRAAYPQ